MRKSAAKLLRKAAEGNEQKYKKLKAAWKGQPWTEKTKLRKYVESKPS